MHHVLMVQFLYPLCSLVFFYDRDAEKLQKFRDDSKKMQREKHIEKMRKGGKLGVCSLLYNNFMNS